MKNTAIGIIFNSEKTEILLTKRRDIPIWVLPGGGIDEGETAEQAVIREMQEETGLPVEIVRQTGEYTPCNRLTRKVHVFECKANGNPPTLSEETVNIGFFPFTRLPKVFFPLHEEWLEDALQGKSDVIKRPIANLTYWRVIKYFFKHPIIVIRSLLAKIGYPINTKKRIS